MNQNCHFLLLIVADTPTNVMSELIGDQTIQLSWSAPASSTPSIAGYEVFYAVYGSNVTQSGGTTTTSTTTISVTLPILDEKYDIFVVAFSDAGNALPSERSKNSTIILTEMGLFITK